MDGDIYLVKKFVGNIIRINVDSISIKVFQIWCALCSVKSEYVCMQFERGRMSIKQKRLTTVIEVQMAVIIIKL